MRLNAHNLRFLNEKGTPFEDRTVEPSLLYGIQINKCFFGEKIESGNEKLMNINNKIRKIRQKLMNKFILNLF